MRRRAAKRWETTFGKFVARVGVVEIRRALARRGQRVTKQGIYAWVAGTRAPRPDCALAMVAISGGMLRHVEEIYRHRKQICGGIGARDEGSESVEVVGGETERDRRI